MITASWSELADRAAAHLDHPFSSVKEPNPEAHEAMGVLVEAIVAEGVERKAAEMAVTAWMLLRNPDGSRVSITDCVAKEVGESG